MISAFTPKQRRQILPPRISGVLVHEAFRIETGEGGPEGIQL